MRSMDDKIRSVVKMFHYPMWFIKLNKNIVCPCVNHTTKEAKAGCHFCLGTGYKISLIRAKAARQTTETIGMRGEGLGYSEKNASDIYYSLDDLQLREGDIIVDNDSVDIVQWYHPGRTDASHPVYNRTSAVRMKINTNIFLDAFHSLIRRNGYA